MGLAAAALRAAAGRPHVLVLPMGGGTEARLAAEAELRRRDWPQAYTPADTDILLIAGPSTVDLADPLARLWAAVPAPRTRIEIEEPTSVRGELDRAAAQLADVAAQRLKAPAGTGTESTDMVMPGQGSGHDADTQGMGGMAMPAGPRMADRAPDRDGLTLDQLPVALGPLLAHWPVGLVVQTKMQGDVIQHAKIVPMGGRNGSFWDGPWREAAAGHAVTAGVAARRRAGAHLDSLGRFLALTGWEHAACLAVRLRNDVLGGVPGPNLVPELASFARSVRRSRSLRWLTRGLGSLDPRSLDPPVRTAIGLADVADVTDRYQQWCRQITESAMRFDQTTPLSAAELPPPRGPWAGDWPGCRAVLATLPGLLAGSDLAAARLIIASLDPDLDQLISGLGGTVHGG